MHPTLPDLPGPDPAQKGSHVSSSWVLQGVGKVVHLNKQIIKCKGLLCAALGARTGKVVCGYHQPYVVTSPRGSPALGGHQP